MAAEARLVQTALGPVQVELTAGSGPVVLASHAGVGGVDQAGFMLDWLGGYRRLLVSRPGYLETPLAGRETFERQADLFAAVLDALDLERVAVVTLSSGGPAGYLLAARHPDRVAALVAISSVSGRYEAPHAAGPIAQALFMSRVGEVLTRTLARRAPRQLVTQLLRAESCLTAEQIREQAEHVLRSPEIMAWLRGFTGTLYPYRARRAGTDNDTVQLAAITELPLASIRCPTLVVHGTHDADVPFEHGERAHAQIGGAEHRWIEEGSHLGFWLAPSAEPVRLAAREFLARIS
ncbi:MAG TPA: alpha/beta hydrolase [Pseudonocardiaceae bacterium]|nr:alpha/beta hydrolase [Pseudonocardiaceae bacterium]